MSIATLAVRRAVTHQTMRLIVQKLVEQGLVTLTVDNEDRRAWVVDLTDTGRAQTAQARDARSQWLTEQLLTKTSREERAVLEAAVRTLN
ncbi:MarR family transcriptional regulator, partial [Achromobacter sp. SIMBA_011]|uniref:MarR family winged helix-turn-helix transcriptional regulator n=1 Tax=Achromobacter sp. SIMBA_011 TaxID=3085759 RepID=UPI003979CF61